MNLFLSLIANTDSVLCFIQISKQLCLGYIKSERWVSRVIDTPVMPPRNALTGLLNTCQELHIKECIVLCSSPLWLALFSSSTTNEPEYLKLCSGNNSMHLDVHSAMFTVHLEHPVLNIQSASISMVSISMYDFVEIII